MHIADTHEDCKKLIADTKASLTAVNQDIATTACNIINTGVPDFRCEMFFEKVQGISWKSYYKAINSV